jgi:antirestriction protein ArdC
MPPSKKALAAWRKAGSPAEEKPRTYFRLVPVFDRSQVDPLPEHPGGPAPLSRPHEPIEGERLERFRRPLSALAASLGSEVSFEPIPGAAGGYHEPASGRIVVDNSAEHSANSEIQTLVHELAHLLIRAERDEYDPKLSYRSEEVVVESVAFTVCAGLGLDTAADSVPYVAGWGGAEAANQVEHYAQLVDRLAARIEGTVSEPKREKR